MDADEWLLRQFDKEYRRRVRENGGSAAYEDTWVRPMFSLESTEKSGARYRHTPGSPTLYDLYEENRDE